MRKREGDREGEVEVEQSKKIQEEDSNGRQMDFIIFIFLLDCSNISLTIRFLICLFCFFLSFDFPSFNVEPYGDDEEFEEGDEIDDDEEEVEEDEDEVSERNMKIHLLSVSTYEKTVYSILFIIYCYFLLRI